ncbi:hypothetical protein M514_04459 [Trichuris suis]|uniref:Secreted protein n=1 Tax=Trichuris suis TaxID=68888 RepID=A0A085N4X9_9BILA|nr:hypothetical protein M514_04459 [Trichuris suis]
MRHQTAMKNVPSLNVSSLLLLMFPASCSVFMRFQSVHLRFICNGFDKCFNKCRIVFYDMLQWSESCQSKTVVSFNVLLSRSNRNLSPQVKTETVIKSFQKCSMSTALDGIEDDELTDSDQDDVNL